ncbi:MAG: hypothetical protein IPI53_12945 [Saprospiraceae bacterium]|nr:hypothetical protein [Saprospiraceae bacterium]
MYIGNLDCNLEESLKWTGFSIFHLVCPILAEIEVIYLDYTNPNKPEVINYKEVNSFETPFEGLNYGDNFFLKAFNRFT